MNLLIIDLRNPEKNITSGITIHNFITYLFEPNGTKYSYQYHNVDKIDNYINQANLIFKNKNIISNLNLEVIGGDYGGLQTSLGEESVDFFGRYKKKKDIPYVVRLVIGLFISGYIIIVIYHYRNL